MKTMDIYTRVGSKIKFSFPDNGYQGDQTHAANHLTEGHTYTVRRIDVGRSSSRVNVTEIPGAWFNTVMFSNVDTE